MENQNQKRKMDNLIFSADDFAEANINTAQSCLIRANTSSNKEEKIKSLVIAERLINGTLKSFGVNIQDLKIEKEKNKK